MAWVTKRPLGLGQIKVAFKYRISVESFLAKHPVDLLAQV